MLSKLQQRPVLTATVAAVALSAGAWGIARLIAQKRRRTRHIIPPAPGTEFPLPDELLGEVFKFLSLDDLQRMRLVSRSWRVAALDKNLWMRLNRTPLTYKLQQRCEGFCLLCNLKRALSFQTYPSVYSLSSTLIIAGLLAKFPSSHMGMQLLLGSVLEIARPHTPSSRQTAPITIKNEALRTGINVIIVGVCFTRVAVDMYTGYNSSGGNLREMFGSLHSFWFDAGVAAFFNFKSTAAVKNKILHPVQKFIYDKTLSLPLDQDWVALGVTAALVTTTYYVPPLGCALIWALPSNGEKRWLRSKDDDIVVTATEAPVDVTLFRIMLSPIWKPASTCVSLGSSSVGLIAGAIIAERSATGWILPTMVIGYRYPIVAAAFAVGSLWVDAFGYGVKWRGSTFFGCQTFQRWRKRHIPSPLKTTEDQKTSLAIMHQEFSVHALKNAWSSIENYTDQYYYTTRPVMEPKMDCLIADDQAFNVFNGPLATNSILVEGCLEMDLELDGMAAYLTPDSLLLLKDFGMLQELRLPEPAVWCVGHKDVVVVFSETRVYPYSIVHGKFVLSDGKGSLCAPFDFPTAPPQSMYHYRDGMCTIVTPDDTITLLCVSSSVKDEDRVIPFSSSELLKDSSAPLLSVHFSPQGLCVVTTQDPKVYAFVGLKPLWSCGSRSKTPPRYFETQLVAGGELLAIIELIPASAHLEQLRIFFRHALTGVLMSKYFEESYAAGTVQRVCFREDYFVVLIHFADMDMYHLIHTVPWRWVQASRERKRGLKTKARPRVSLRLNLKGGATPSSA